MPGPHESTPSSPETHTSPAFASESRCSRRASSSTRSSTNSQRAEEIEAAAAELDPRFAAIPVFAAGTGLRPEEWIALERRDLDRKARVVSVSRVYSQGRLKQCSKSSRQRRRVPLRQRVLDALDAQPRRPDSPLLFPAARGGHIDLEKFRYRQWAPAIYSAGIEPHRRI